MASGANGSTTPAAEEAKVLETTKAFLACIRNYDPETMHSLVLPNGSACLLRPHQAHVRDQPMIMTLKACIDRVFELETPENEPDEQGFDETVHVDGEIACVWCPYRFLKRGVLHHTGSNMFSLVKVEDKWLISGVADVSRLA